MNYKFGFHEIKIHFPRINSFYLANIDNPDLDNIVQEFIMKFQVAT